jgi:hypothetical protein
MQYIFPKVRFIDARVDDLLAGHISGQIPTLAGDVN